MERGGKFIQTDIKNIEQININETAVSSENEEYKFEKAEQSACGRAMREEGDEGGGR